jgi:hypothetical protein
MIFKARVGTFIFFALLDFGAANCFITTKLCKLLNAKPATCNIKAVELAYGIPRKVDGFVSVPTVHWLQKGESALDFSIPLPQCLVLQSLVDGTDIIIGQEFHANKACHSQHGQ